HIPRLKAVFEESLETSTGYIRQVKSGTAKPADAVGFSQQNLDDAQVFVVLIQVGVWKSASEQRFEKCGYGRHFNSVDIASRRTLNGSVVTFVMTHFMHYAKQQAIFFGEGDADRKYGQAVQKVGGAIKGIDNPVVFLIVRPFYRAFFGDEA